MEYYGITDQVYYDVYVASETSFREFDFDGYTYRYVVSKDMEGVETPALSGGIRITNLERTHKYIYTLKDLRNAIAHNSVVFDTRFRNIDPSSAMKQCLKIEIGLPYVNFKTIGDYVILMCYYMKLLQVPKTEIKAFVREFERITEDYRKAVNANVASIAIHPDLASRMNLLKNFL